MNNELPDCQQAITLRLAPYLPRAAYPKPQANGSNQLHEVDGVGPIYLKGNRQHYYIFVLRIPLCTGND